MSASASSSSKLKKKSYFSGRQSSSSKVSSSGSVSENVLVGQLAKEVPTLYPITGGHTTSYISWLSQWTPYSGRETSSRAQSALRKKLYFPADTKTLSRDDEKGMSKTEMSAQEDLTTESSRSNRQDQEYLKAAFSLLTGSASTQSAGALKPLCLQEDEPQSWDEVLAVQDATTMT